MNKKVAFTLAEVLITLGIIGIVSAMTIPTLINNYKEKVRDNQFKKVYATLNQALRMTVADFDYVPKCYYPVPAKINDCILFYDKFKEKLKIVKDCPEKSVELGCTPEYAGLEVVLKENHKNDPDYDEQYWENYANNLLRFKSNYLKTIVPSFVLSNGFIVIVYSYQSYINSYPLFAIDINGFKGPNKWGHDLFMFRFSYDGNKFYLSPSDNPSFAGGISTYRLVKKLFGTYIP